MKIIGIDTSTKFLSLGACDGEKVYEYNIDLGTKHSVLLVPTIKRVIDALDWRVQDIDYFACGLGPGSFTGIRVGLATIKGLAWAAKKPVIGVSTLDILAKSVNLPDCVAVPALDAKRGLIYCSVYRIKNRVLKRTQPYMLLSQEKFLEKIRDNVVVFGDAVDLYREKIAMKAAGVSILERDSWYPKGHNIIALALEKIKGRKPVRKTDVEPIYLYPKECQIKKI
jgi:tRNA threonylcarbamoyladenosine biosynthesis protein TsaB